MDHKIEFTCTASVSLQISRIPLRTIRLFCAAADVLKGMLCFSGPQSGLKKQAAGIRNRSFCTLEGEKEKESRPMTGSVCPWSLNVSLWMYGLSSWIDWPEKIKNHQKTGHTT